MKRPTLVAGAGLAALALALAGCSGSAAGESASGDNTYRIGVLQIAQATLLDDITAAFEASVKSGMGPDVNVEFDVKNANGDQSLIASISRDFASSDDDAFAVLGTPAVIALAGQVTDRPIFAIAMGDPVGAGVADSLDAPGKNVTGSIDYIDPALLLDDLITMYPQLGTLGTLYDPSNQNMQIWVKALEQATKDEGIALSEATVASSAETAQAARSLVGRADVVLVGPDALVISGMDAVGAAMGGSSIPLFVVGGDLTVPGVLGTLGPDYPALGTAAGEGAVQVLKGASPGTIPFAAPDGLQIGISAQLAATYGLTIPASLADRVTEQ
jgi:putative tryptophan/tyrosine transport system substrate-binding protein